MQQFGKNMKQVFTLLTTFFCYTANAQVSVKVHGAMSQIMRKGDLSAAVDIDTLARQHLFALGPVAGLKGEIMVVDGTVYTSVRSGDTIQNVATIPKAAMLVYSYVSEWKQLEKKVTISNLRDLEKMVEHSAKEGGVDTAQPFVFMVEAKAKRAGYHVIHWEDGIKHTLDNHKQFAIHKEEKEQDVILLGFYSKHHHSIFTHHSTNMHVHILSRSRGIAGHLDDIQIEGPVTMHFPLR